MINELQQFSFQEASLFYQPLFRQRQGGERMTEDEANAKWQDLEHDPEGRLEWEQAANERKVQWLEQFADTMI